jgi:hypothetical protein
VAATVLIVMTITANASGQLTVSDSRGRLINGSVGVPDATHNMYCATVTSCGSLDGHLRHGALVGASAMQGPRTWKFDDGRLANDATPNFRCGSGAPVRGLRMQSFSRDPLPGDGGHPRTTAVSVAGLLGGVIEGQVPG